MRRYGLLLLALGIGDSARAESAMESPMDAAKAIVTWAGDKVPGLEPLVSDYLAVLGPDSYSSGAVLGGNRGLVDYVDTLALDPKFSQQVKAFYGELSQLDQSYRQSRGPLGPPRLPLGTRPYLSMTSADVAQPALRDGWLWDLALKHGEKNPLVAMRLIGVCGHDDMGRDFTLAGDEGEYSCPVNDSLMFVPGGLGSGVDVSETMRKRVIYDQEFPKREAKLFALSQLPPAQLPRHGAYIPAKHYHVLGAAFVSCELAARGHSPHVVALLQRALGWAYRLQRFNSEGSARRAVLLREMSEAEENLKLPGLSAENRDRFRQTVAERRLRLDTIDLMAKRALGGETYSFGSLKVPLPQTNFRLELPRWVDDSRLGQWAQRPRGWPKERYQRALANYRAWMTDWEWTAEQHAAGGNFGAFRCAKTSAP